MRKLLWTALAVALCGILLVGSANAQMGFGVKAGLNMADLQDLKAIDTIDKLENESKTGFVGGAYLKFPFGPLKLQVEGLYSLKGAKGTSFNGLSSAEWETKLTYLEFPVLLRYEMPTPMLKPFFYGGASVALLTKAEERNSNTDSSWEDIKDGLKTTDYGLVVGAGVELLGLTVEGRYTHGLADTVDQKTGNMLVDEAKNRTWSVMAGFDFF